MIASRTFYFREGRSDKFWTATISGNTVVCEWGRRGTKGQSKTFTYSSSWQAERFFEDKCREKLDKNYYETSAPLPPLNRQSITHLDGNPRNNSPSNIRVTTASENAPFARFQETMGQPAKRTAKPKPAPEPAKPAGRRFRFNDSD